MAHNSYVARGLRVYISDKPLKLCPWDNYSVYVIIYKVTCVHMKLALKLLYIDAEENTSTSKFDYHS